MKRTRASRSVVCTGAFLFALAACAGDDSNGQDACSLDCAGICNGAATTDRCGACDSDPSNDCWDGNHGTTRLNAWPMPAAIGDGKVAYSLSDVGLQRGFFYSGNAMTMPALEIAQTTAANACDPSGQPDVGGYAGLVSVRDLVDASSLSYDTTGRTVMFGTEASSCYTGLLVFRQAGRYAVVRFIDINEDETLDIEFWLGAQGVTDFRNAP